MLSITKNILSNIVQLAYLNNHSEENKQLMEDINAILFFVDQLQKVDTNGIKPLFHPLDIHQRLRNDKITVKNCAAELAASASHFKDGLYLVPKVIDFGR